MIIAKMRWGHLKIFFSRTIGPEKLKGLGSFGPKYGPASKIIFLKILSKGIYNFIKLLLHVLATLYL
jgi:hypothetical protein